MALDVEQQLQLFVLETNCMELECFLQSMLVSADAPAAMLGFPLSPNSPHCPVHQAKLAGFTYSVNIK